MGGPVHSKGTSLRTHLSSRGSGVMEDGLANVLLDLVPVAKTISREVNTAGLHGIVGVAGTTNVHGETVQKLDVFANELMIEHLRAGGRVCAMASEEEEELIPPYEAGESAEYIVYFDPLDGSSNIDVNVSIGTIFSVYRRKSAGGPITSADLLQKGSAQVAAGYFLYGSSTMLVYTAGNGVHGFTLDSSTGEFRLSHPGITTPGRGNIYSCNEGHSETWDAGTRAYVASLKDAKGGKGRPYSARYVGSFVSDFHRNLLKGGIFLYPANQRDPSKPRAGKLRLMYEANPMAFVAEQAGGRATDGLNRILEIQPSGIHQRVPIVVGSPDDVGEYESYIEAKVIGRSKGAA